MSYIEGRTEVSEEDLSIVSLPVVSNKPYHIELLPSAKVTLVIVVKAHQKPVLDDFYGGDRLSMNATLLVVDFNGTIPPMRKKTALGLECIEVDVNRTSVSFFGTMSYNKETAMVYFGLMPAVYDAVLCNQCLERSNRECGFCSGKNGSSTTEVKRDVFVAIARHAPVECVYWNNTIEKWTTDGCEVRVFDVQTIRLHARLCVCAWW